MVLGGRVVILDQLRLRRSLAQLLGLPAGRRREEPHLALELDQLLIGVRLHFQALELLDEGIAREVLVHLGRRDQLALLVLDLLGHALERLEHALVADRGHGFLDALVRLGALLPRDQDVLLALRLLDPIVQLAERQLELLGFLAMLHPRLVQLHRALRVLVVTQQGLLREVVPPLLHRQHGPALPILGALLLGVHLRRETLLVRDGRRHLLFGLRQLTAHVDDQLVQHLFRILGTVDQVVDVRPDQRRETVKDSHENPRCAGGASLSRAQLTLPRPGEQALRKIYPLLEFRHFPPQLFDRREHVLLPCRATRLALRLELRQVSPAQDERDHGPEEPPDRDDGDQNFHRSLSSPFIYPVRSAGPRGSAPAAVRRSPYARRAPPPRAARPRAPGPGRPCVPRALCANRRHWSRRSCRGSGRPRRDRSARRPSRCTRRPRK